MKLERAGVSSYVLTLHAYELASLASAARWVVEGGEGEVPVEAKAQLSQVLAQYEAQLSRMQQEPA